MKKIVIVFGGLFVVFSSFLVGIVFAQSVTTFPYTLPSGRICASFEECRTYCMSTERIVTDADACLGFMGTIGTTSTTTSSSVTETPLINVPEVPTKFVLTHQNGPEVVFSWMDNSSTEDQFKIYVQTSLVPNKEILSVPANQMTATLTVEPGKNYFRIRACNNAGCSPESNAIGVEVVSGTVMTTSPTATETNTTLQTSNTEQNTSLSSMTAPPPVVIQAQSVEEQKLLINEQPQGSATITGTLVDVQGAPLALAGFAEVFYSDTKLGRAAGVSFSNGTFSVQVLPGTYYVRMFLSPGSGYTVSLPQQITITDTKAVKFIATANTITITGQVFEGVIQANDVKGRIIGSNKEGAWQETPILADGSYTMHVAPGTWLIGIEVPAGSGFVYSGSRQFSVDISAANLKVERNFSLERAVVVLDGSVLDENDVGVSDVYIAIGKGQYSPDAMSTNSLEIVRKITTDAKGYFSTTVAPGTYYIKTFVRADRGYINAKERRIDATGSHVTVNFELQRPELAISGLVYSNGAPVSNAFVWAWSKAGGYQETFSNESGAYSLRVPPNTSWVVVAAAHVLGTEYRADEVVVDVATTLVTHDVELHRAKVLPKAAIVKTDATLPSVVTVAGDGPRVVAPAGAFSDAGTVAIAVVPDTRAPSQGQTKVVGTAYDFTASNDSGENITKFTHEVVITIPYADADITALGVNENTLVLSFWDEGVSAWKNVENSIVNAAQNTVTASVNHFTRYAVLAPADITPPQAPIVSAALALGTGKIKILWSNPVKDFDHTKIYRSDKKGILGAIIVPELRATEYTDNTGLSNGLAYHYTVRAVDPAGNESNNMTQVSAVAIGNSVSLSSTPKISTTVAVSQNTAPTEGKVTGKLSRTLKMGARGPDVTALQKLLVQENVYPEGKITGYFGAFTKAAVIRFQEKYMSEVLTPAGLVRGTGVVGVKTRTKMNSLFAL